MPKYYPINEEAARRAKNANSFSDYVPGSATAAYREMVDRAYTLGKQQKGRVDPMYHEKIDGLIDRYARKLAENINQCNLIDARVPSILIAGGSNFPVRKKEKQNAARDKNMGEYMQIEGLLDKVRSTGMGGISADDDRAVEKLEAKLAGLEAMHSIKHNRLEAAVLFAVQQQIHLAVSYSEMIARINTAPVKKSQSIRLEELIAAKERELAKISRYKQSLYQDWKDGEITQQDYRDMKADYERQTIALTDVLARLNAERAELANGVKSEHPALVAFTKHQNIDQLSRELLVELIDHIKVYENGNISVRFKFADEFRRIAEYIEINTTKPAVAG